MTDGYIMGPCVQGQIRKALNLVESIDSDTIELPCNAPFHFRRHDEPRGSTLCCPRCCSSWWALNGEEQPPEYIIAAVLRGALSGTDVASQVVVS